MGRKGGDNVESMNLGAYDYVIRAPNRRAAVALLCLACVGWGCATTSEFAQSDPTAGDYVRLHQGEGTRQLLDADFGTAYKAVSAYLHDSAYYSVDEQPSAIFADDYHGMYSVAVYFFPVSEQGKTIVEALFHQDYRRDQDSRQLQLSLEDNVLDNIKLRLGKRRLPADSVQAPKEFVAISDVDEVARIKRRASRPGDFALVIGVRSYRSLPETLFADRDAYAFALYAERVLGVPRQNVKLLLNDSALKTDLLKNGKEWLRRNAHGARRVYFFFAGHGAVDPASGAAYLLPWDGDPAHLESTASPTAKIYAGLARLGARHVVVFLDTCFSPGPDGRAATLSGERPLALLARDSVPLAPGLSVMTASQESETAGTLDREGHGLFTYFLLKELAGAPARHLTLGDLYSRVKRAVEEAARRQNRDQTPRLVTSEPELKLF